MNFTSSTYTAIKNAKRDYITARVALETASAAVLKAMTSGTKQQRQAARRAQAQATDRIIALTAKLHAACLNDAELIARVAAEIDEEVAEQMAA